MTKFKFWLLLFMIFSSCNKKKEQIFPEVKDIHEFVYSSVTVQPDSLYQVYAAVNGILEENLVEEGDIVKNGTNILQIIATASELNSQNARLSYDLAKKNYEGNANILDEVLDEIGSAHLKLKNDSINYFRLNRLWDYKIGSKAQLDAAKLAYDLSLKNLELLKNKYNRTKSDLEIQISQAQNTYKNSVVVQKDFTVKSSINGKVYALYKKKGEVINVMEPVASLGSASNFVLEMLVDEVDIVRIKIGQSVFVNLDSYPEKVFLATVSKIFPKKDERNQTFKIEAIFQKEPSVLYPGLSGEADIEIASKMKALIIPKKYLTVENQVKTDVGLETVKTGLQTLDSIEILSGINAETAIYTLP